MNQFMSTSGFEVVTFAWDQLPAFVRGANRGAATPPPAYAALRVAAASATREHAGLDEEPERWDGLS